MLPLKLEHSLEPIERNMSMLNLIQIIILVLLNLLVVTASSIVVDDEHDEHDVLQVRTVETLHLKSPLVILTVNMVLL
jgi:hypothetical protein